MVVEVKTYTSKEVLEYKERKYQQFLTYYFSTDMKIDDIFRAIGFNNDRNSTVKYIRNKLKSDGYNSLERARSIKNGNWL